VPVMSLAELAKCLIPIYKFTANGLSIAMLDFLGNLIGMCKTNPPCPQARTLLLTQAAGILPARS